MNIFNKFTLKTLQKNKTRTLVTIIGIVLSIAMLTAVTTSISSMQDYLFKTAIAKDGDWQGVYYDMSAENHKKLILDSEVKDSVALQNIGYAKLSGCSNEYKPYLFIGGIEDAFTETMPVNLIEGRLPKDSNEILLPNHLATNGGVKYSIGDSLDLEVGERYLDGEQLDQLVGYYVETEGKREEIVDVTNHTYTVVGFYERLSIENFSSPGYLALTVAEKDTSFTSDVYFKLNKPKNIYDFMRNDFSDASSTNMDYLLYSGISNDNAFNRVYYGLGAILIGIIMFGSISLIYNSFSISVSERTKQFGLLSSVGATKRQLLRSVIFEALTLCIIGILVGLLAGLAGMGITLKCMQTIFAELFSNETKIMLQLSVSWMAILVAVLVGLITVTISAYIPAKRALKVSAMDSIRQTSDVNIKARKVKTSKLTYRFFGFEGMIASKNYKRSRKRYRATIISLFMSIVLFISASSFCSYLTASMGDVMMKSEYDLIYSPTHEMIQEYSIDEIYEELASVSGVNESSYYAVRNEFIKISKTNVKKDFLDFTMSEQGKQFVEMDGDDLLLGVSIYFLDDISYEKYLESYSFDKEKILDIEHPKAITLDFFRYYQGDEGKYYTFHTLKKNEFETSVMFIKEMEGYYYSGYEIDVTGNKTYQYSSGEEGPVQSFTEEEATDEIVMQVGAVTDEKPFSVDYNFSGITMIYPYTSMPKVLGIHNEGPDYSLCFKVDNHKEVYKKMIRVLEEKGLSTSSFYNYAENNASNRALIMIINIFSYGFITLISLIAVANVFNTISTNVNLRRREFAMLKSMGMTQKGFRKMMNFECLLYGVKGLMYGIPVAVGITYLIYRSILNGWETGFYIPWYSIVISIGSVFAIVFATMLYSMSKIKKDNPIDALKNENL